LKTALAAKWFSLSLGNQSRNERIITCLGLAVLTGLVIFLRLHSLHEPLEHDITSFAYIGHDLLSGGKLYTDLWEIKPPGIFLIYALAERVWGYGPQAVNYLGITFALLAMGFVFLILRRLANGYTALFGSALWALASNAVLLLANVPKIELFINAFMLLGVWGLVEYVYGRKTFLWLAGTAFALGTYLKINVLFPVLTLSLYFAFPIPGAGWGKWAREKIRLYLKLFLPALVLWALTCVYFFILGRFGDFYAIVFRATSHYAGHMAENIRHFFTTPALLASPRLKEVAVLWILALGWLVLPRSRTRPLKRGFFLLWLVGEYIMISAVRIVHPYYYQVLLPVVTIMAALFLWDKVAFLGGRESKLKIPAVILLLAFSLGYLAYFQAEYLRLSPEQISVEQYGSDVFVKERELGRILGKMTQPGERLFQWGTEPGFYFYSRRQASSGILFILYVYDTYTPDLIEKMERKILQDVASRPPAFFIFNTWLGKPEDNLFYPFLLKNYRRFSTFDRYILYEYRFRKPWPQDQG